MREKHTKMVEFCNIRQVKNNYLYTVTRLLELHTMESSFFTMISAQLYLKTLYEKAGLA
jgi:hypothetical protein